MTDNTKEFITKILATVQTAELAVLMTRHSEEDNAELIKVNVALLKCINDIKAVIK